MPFPQVAVVMRAGGEPLTLADAAASLVSRSASSDRRVELGSVELHHLMAEGD